jgi:lipopolysaccharide export system protein LptA
MKKLFLCLCLFSFFGGKLLPQKNTNVILEHSESLSFDKTRDGSYQVLRGNVRFRHDNALMYCDSAYFYDGQNSFDAFGNVRVIQQSMTLNANKMFYNGNTKLLRARGNVILNTEELTIHTDNMDFDRTRNFGYYFDGGKTTEPQFEITSVKGYYYPDTKTSVFNENVVLTNPDFSIHTDTLRYNSTTEIAYVTGPSHIYYDQYTIYTTNGWSNTTQNFGMLYDYSVITSTDGKRITADSIAFDRNGGWTKTYHNIDIRDTVQKSIFKGDYGIFYDNPQSGIVTDRAYMIDYSSADSLFLHADTLSFVAPDSTSNIMKAYHNVRFFRKDLQGKCDSLTYITTDSVIDMQGDPVLWSEESQLTGDIIKIYMKNNIADWIHITSNAMISSLEDSTLRYYNQLSGRESKAYIIDGELRIIDMIGNAVSIYFTKDRKEDLIGINKAEGSTITIHLKDKEFYKIKATQDPKGNLYPPDKMPGEELFLRNFTWQKDIRPRNKEDIFTRY